jgi:hypothetical protein
MEPGCSRGSPCSKPQNHAGLRATGTLSHYGRTKDEHLLEILEKLREFLPRSGGQELEEWSSKRKKSRRRGVLASPVFKRRLPIHFYGLGSWMPIFS